MTTIRIKEIDYVNIKSCIDYCGCKRSKVEYLFESLNIPYIIFGKVSRHYRVEDCKFALDYLKKIQEIKEQQKLKNKKEKEVK